MNKFFSCKSLFLFLALCSFEACYCFANDSDDVSSAGSSTNFTTPKESCCFFANSYAECLSPSECRKQGGASSSMNVSCCES